MKWKVGAALLLLIIGGAYSQSSLAGRKMRLNPPVAGPKTHIANERIGVAIGADGRFTIGTTDGKALLFGYPREGGSSHTHFYVDGNIYGTYGDPGDHPPEPTMVSPVTNLSGTAVCQWAVGDVLITQRLSPTHWGEQATVLIEYTFENTGTAAHSVGLMLFLDTMIGSNDYAPIATEYGYFSVEREFTAPDVPSFWQAYESSPFQPPDSLVGEGIISGGSALPPDRLIYGDFWNYHSVEWDYSLVGGPYSDSAILMRWGTHLLHPGEVWTIATYYGEGTMVIGGDVLALSASSPTELVPTHCDELSPNPFTLNLLVSNTSRDTVRGVIASITLPDGCSLVGGVATGSTDPPNLAPGRNGTVSWSISVDEMFDHDTTICFTVEATGYGIPSSSVDKCIEIRSGDGEAPLISLFSPAEGSIISQDDFDVAISIADPSGVDESRMSALWNGSVISYADTAHFHYDYDLLRLTLQTEGLSDGENELMIRHIADMNGCEIPETSFVFTIDRTPPSLTLVSPAFDRDTIYSPEYNIRFIVDDISPITADSIRINIMDVGVLSLLSEGVSFDGRRLTIASSAISPHFGTEYTLSICIDGVMDTPDIGYPNRADESCYTFYVNGNAPSVSFVTPDFGDISSCDTVIVRAEINHPAGIDPASIVVMVDGIAGVPFNWDGSTAEIPIPTETFGLTSGDTLRVDISATSLSGVVMPHPAELIIVMDKNAPIAELISASLLNSPSAPIEIAISDDIAGVDWSSVSAELIWNGETTPTTITTDSETGIVSVDISGLTLTGCDSVICEISAADLADGCSGNRSTTAITIRTPCTPPELSLTESPTGCDTIYLTIRLEDDEGIIYDSLYLEINGTRYPLPDAEEEILTADGTMRIAIPADYLIADGRNSIVIGGACDSFYVHSSNLMLDYYYDKSAPNLVSVIPEPATALRLSPTNMDWLFADSSGIDPTTIAVYADAMPVPFVLADGHITFSVDISDGADSLEVCVHTADIAECANSSDTCITYAVDMQAPNAMLISPSEGVNYGCNPATLVIELTDPDGVDRGSIELSVNGTLFSGSYDDSLLTLTLPDDFFSDGDAVSIVLSAADIYGHSAEFNWGFTIDYVPPMVVYSSPTPETVATRQEPVKIVLSDELAGVDFTSRTFSLNTTTYLTTLHSDTILFDPALAGVMYSDTNIVELTIGDFATDCPNELRWTSQFYCGHEPLSVDLISPDGFYGCDSAQLIWRITSPTSFDASNLELLSDGVAVDFSISGDTILSYVSLAEGVVGINIYGIADEFGFLYPDTLHYDIRVDKTPPLVLWHSPAQGTHTAGTFTFGAVIMDNAAGLDKESTSINGDNADISNIHWADDTLYADVSPVSVTEESLRITLNFRDKALGCPNENSVSFAYYIEPPALVVSVMEPINGSISTIRRQSVKLSVDALREDALSSLRLVADGDTFSIGNGLVWVSDSAMAVFSPSRDWSEGEHSLSVLADGVFIHWQFKSDFSPPYVVDVSPMPNMALDKPPVAIGIKLNDDILGVNTNSIQIEINSTEPPISSISSGNDGWLFISTDWFSISAGDTISVKLISVEDQRPSYGTPNKLLAPVEWSFRVKKIGWSVNPQNTFTPNGDGMNDELVFEFNDMQARVIIYDMNGNHLRKLASSNGGKVIWDGRRDNGKLVNPGVYLYTIVSDGDVIYTGTIVVAR